MESHKSYKSLLSGSIQSSKDTDTAMYYVKAMNKTLERRKQLMLFTEEVMSSVDILPSGERKKHFELSKGMYS